MSLDAVVRERRLSKLRGAMDSADLDVVAIGAGATLLYLTGGTYALMERPTVLIIPIEGEMRMILPALEANSWSGLSFPARPVIWQDTDGYDGAFAEATSGLTARRVGVEGQRMRVFESRALIRHLPEAEIVDAHPEISSIRVRKEQEEIEALRRAIDLSETALDRTLQAIKIGMSEKVIHRLLLAHMFDTGADALAFQPIVISGAQSASPHASAGNYVPKRGETLLFDFGVASGGYNADITRTVFVGDPQQEARDFYNTVYEANRLGREAVCPGMTANTLDNTVLAFLEKSRFGKYVLHKTGHGLGLDVHEAPQIMRGNAAALEEGMVFTIEPGLYIPGVRGVRIEDDVVVTRTGGESLTRFPRELLVVG